MLVFCTILCSTSAMAGTSHPSCCHTRSLWRVSIFFPSYPRFQAGIHSKGNQDGFPINNVGNDGEREILASVFALARRSATARKREYRLHGNDRGRFCPSQNSTCSLFIRHCLRGKVKVFPQSLFCLRIR